MASEAFWQLRKRHCLLSTKAISIFLFKLKRGKKIYLHTRHEQVCDVFVTLACSRHSEIVGSGVKSKAARKNENTIWTPGIGYRHIVLSSLVILKRSVQSCLKTVNLRPPNRKKNYSFLNTDFYGWAKCKVLRTPTEFGLPVLGRDREHGEIEFWQLEVLCITSGRMLSRWHSPFKPVTSRTQTIVLKSETLILTWNNSANSLSLLSCHSSSKSVSIPVYL